MGLKKKIRFKGGYQFTVFLPIIAILWGIVIFSWLSQYRIAKDYRSDILRSRIGFMNEYALYLAEEGHSPVPYFDFVEKYYDATVLDNLSITLYDTTDGTVIAQTGFPAPPPEQMDKLGNMQGADIAAHNNDDSTYIHPDRMFFYRVAESPDGRYLVQTMLPFDGRVKEAIKPNSWTRYLLIVSVALITIILYTVTRHMSKSVRMLREFVNRAATDHDFVAVDKFPNDDLGDISRQVVNIYNMRKAAMASRELEHRVALKAIEERTNLKRQLTNNINHELKTPAGIIKGYIDTIIENPEMDEDSRKHFLIKTQEHIERLCNILNDLSTITRLEDGSQNISIEKIDFTKLIRDLAEDVEESGLNKDMRLQIDLPEHCYIKGNFSLLTAAIMNLTKNSVAYSKGTMMGIKLLTQNHKFYTFCFYDDGVGVPEDAIPQLFDRFFRVDKGRSRKAGGTGLGLPIVRNSLNTMGGSISVKNGAESGLEFAFTLLKWKDDERPHDEAEDIHDDITTPHNDGPQS